MDATFNPICGVWPVTTRRAIANAAEEFAAAPRPPRVNAGAGTWRKRAAAYGMLTPGALYLAIAFIVPMILVVYTSLQSGGVFSGGFTTAPGRSRTTPRALSRFGSSTCAALLYWAGLTT